jgi:RNA polymerase sigma-70 factor (ECF subfamily)
MMDSNLSSPAYGEDGAGTNELGPQSGGEPAGLAALEKELVETCRSALPELDVDADAFTSYVNAHRPEGTSATEWLRTIHAVDLYLAFACLENRPHAVRVFERTFRVDIDKALRSLDQRTREDAQQVLKQRLFAARQGGAAAISSYSGCGPLRRWLRVTSSRIMLELVDKRATVANDWEVEALPAVQDNPELAYLKARYRTEYKQAFERAYAELDDRARTVLAQYHIDLLTIDQLATLYNVHRATAARRVLSAQEQLRQRIVNLLEERLGLSADDLRSITRLVRSQLSLSLPRVMHQPG